MLAIDPSSPFTGGAILGDRVRMQDHATDPGVFIRSMATRGHLGGLALAAPEAVRLLDAVGKPWIIVETVGVGQVEVEVAGAGRHHRRRRQPGLGRRACRPTRPASWRSPTSSSSTRPTGPASAETRRDLELMLDLSDLGDWRPPIVADGGHRRRRASATLWQAVEAHRASIEKSGQLRAASRRARLRDELRQHRRPAPRGPGPGAVPGRRPTTSWSARVLERGHRPVGRGRRAARRRRRLTRGRSSFRAPRGSTA